jgi:hypothetical protein
LLGRARNIIHRVLLPDRRFAFCEAPRNPIFKGDVMDEPDFDLDEYRTVLRERVLRAVGAAYATLDREARRGRTIRSEFQFRTCLALARLAPALLGAPPPQSPPLQLHGTPDEIEESLCILEHRASHWPRIESSYEKGECHADH